jgi:hypothetical protein
VEEEEHTQEGQKIKRRGIYLWPNLITTAALLAGFYSIIASMNGNFQQAIYAIFIAALLDGLDGLFGKPSCENNRGKDGCIVPSISPSLYQLICNSLYN